MKATGGVCLDGEKNDRMALQARADCRNHAVGWLRTGIQFPWRFPWRWDGGTISLNLGVIWEMSAKLAIDWY